jgi:hypothetical protein
MEGCQQYRPLHNFVDKDNRLMQPDRDEIESEEVAEVQKEQYFLYVACDAFGI